MAKKQFTSLFDMIDKPLGEPVRKFEDTFSIWDVLLVEFFGKTPEEARAIVKAGSRYKEKR